MHIDHTIHIAAPPSLVWDVTVDSERWPELTPTVTAARRVDDGPFDVGSAALITQPGLPASSWTVTALDPGRSFSWEARVRGLCCRPAYKPHPGRLNGPHSVRVNGPRWNWPHPTILAPFSSRIATRGRPDMSAEVP